MIDEEVEFYYKIKDDCNIIFDIGCREDIDYIELGLDKEYHYFEPNPDFFDNCKLKLSKLDNNKIHLNNFGLGNKSEIRKYYCSSQSFMFRSVAVNNINQKILGLPIVKFSEYLKENKIEKIDFIKIDTEGYESYILLDDIDFIKNKVKYIQFEYGSTWKDMGVTTNLLDIFNIFSEVFDFYYLQEERSPLIKKCKDLLTPIIDDVFIDEIQDYANRYYGSNIVMIKKGLYINVPI